MGKNNKTKIVELKVVELIRKITISKRLLISFILISTLPIAIIFLLVNTTSLKLIKNNIISNDKVASQLITTSITDYITKFDYITNEIIWKDNLLKGMSQYTNLNQKEKKLLMSHYHNYSDQEQHMHHILQISQY